MITINSKLVWHVKKKVDGKWKPLLLLMIHKLPMRFNKIKQLLPEISSKVLTNNLKQLEDDSLITKEKESGKFSITEKGRSVCFHVRAMFDILSD